MDLFEEMADIVACSPRAAMANPVADGRHVYAGFPHFRDGSGIPDQCFEITSGITVKRKVTRAEIHDGFLRMHGQAHLTLVGGTTTILLRRWPRGPEYRFAAIALPTPKLRGRQANYPNAEFDVAIELATAAQGEPLKDGVWEIRLVIGTDQVTRTVKVRRGSGEGPAIRSGGGSVTGSTATLYITPAGFVRLRIGAANRLAGGLEWGEMLRSGPGRLFRRVRARLKRTRSRLD
jgi:hypothetical protein